MIIKRIDRPSYQTPDGKWYPTYEEAQKAELFAILGDGDRNVIQTSELTDKIMKHAAEIREILAPQIGRPLGSKNGTGKRRNRVAAAENAALQDMKQ